jgi:hypothetical protein
VTSNGAVLSLAARLRSADSFASSAERGEVGAREGRTAVRVEQFEFANADAAGSASGTYRTSEQGPARSTSLRRYRASTRGTSTRICRA